MNTVNLLGRLTREPDVKYTQGDNPMAIARYTLAVTRRFGQKDESGNMPADFIPCVALGKGGEFAEKYLHKGTKIAIVGRIQTGSYTNKDGVKVYTTDVIVEQQEFAESKPAESAGAGNGAPQYGGQPAGQPATAAPAMNGTASAMSGTATPVHGYRQPAQNGYAQPAQNYGQAVPGGYVQQAPGPGQAQGYGQMSMQNYGGFVNIPEGIPDEELPFA